eukprot:5899136-Pleurochrysis_carterae.AAC.1
MAIPGSPYSMGTCNTTFHADNDVTVTFVAPLPETNNFTVTVTPHYFAGADITCNVQKLTTGTGSPGFRVRMADMNATG